MATSIRTTRAWTVIAGRIIETTHTTTRTSPHHILRKMLLEITESPNQFSSLKTTITLPVTIKTQTQEVQILKPLNLAANIMLSTLRTHSQVPIRPKHSQPINKEQHNPSSHNEAGKKSPNFITIKKREALNKLIGKIKLILYNTILHS